jgi:hypothetical protein
VQNFLSELDGWTMEITFRDAVTVLHGMVFGALLLLAFSGAFVGLYSSSVAAHAWNERDRRFVSWYLIAMAVLGWAAVLAGAYLVYPWYRAIAPAGTIDLAGYPQRMLMAHPLTIGWHSLGMEWKEHIAWFAPITLTTVAFVFVKYGAQLANFRSLRNTVLALAAVALFATAVAAGFGAMLNKYAPVRGGAEIVLFKGADRD